MKMAQQFDVIVIGGEPETLLREDKILITPGASLRPATNP